MAKPDLLLSPLVAEIYDLDAQIETLKTQQATLAAELIEKGEGTYAEHRDPDARKVIVVVPTKYGTKYDLYKPEALRAFLEARQAKKATPELLEEFRAMREDAAEAIAGEEFKTLFDRLVIYSPTDGFEKLVPKLLTTQKGEPSAKARELLLLCQIVTPPKDAYIRLPDKPKATGAPPEEE
jgi:hypothetical protein